MKKLIFLKALKVAVDEWKLRRSNHPNQKGFGKQKDREKMS